jgi:type IV pilus assembly protein PilZ
MSEPSGGSRPGVIPLTIKDKETLHRSYMPFLSEGGIFIPTQRKYRIGDEVVVILTLLDEAQKFPITGKVVWIAAKPAAGRPAGVGIQFSSSSNNFGQNQNTVAQQKIETYLGGLLKSDKPTYTM